MSGRLYLAGLLALVLRGGAGAQGETEVDAELVLAVDVSRSMTAHELEIQRRGYAEAIVSNDVLRAIQDGALQRIAVTYVEWAGAESQRVIVGWTLIGGRADAEAFARRLTAQFNGSLRRTSISGALDYASRLFDGNGFDGARRVIDVSGDGPNNQGRPVEAARDEVIRQGIVINGLPLMTREGMGAQWHLDNLDEYYLNCVIGGPASFVIPVLEWRHFPEAVRRKLVLDLVRFDPEPPDLAVILPAANGYDCTVGEKIWRQIQDDWN